MASPRSPRVFSTALSWEVDLVGSTRTGFTSIPALEKALAPGRSEDRGCFKSNHEFPHAFSHANDASRTKAVRKMP